LQELENWRTKFETASAATEGFFSKRWIAENMFNMSDEEFIRNQREMFYDRKFEAALEAKKLLTDGARPSDQRHCPLRSPRSRRNPVRISAPRRNLSAEEAPEAGEEAAEAPETALLGAPG
jgi:hypothetical protein